MIEIEAGVAEMAIERVAFIFVFPRAHQAREAIEHFRLERERLADFASRRAPAIGDHIGRHRRAQFSVTFVDVLNGALALIAAGKIEIDVGPFAALFGKESLEEQIHAHRIHGGDSQRIADRAIGRRAAALHQNILFAAEANDVPNDQEIAGEIEFFNHRQLALDLFAGFFVVAAIAGNHAFPRAFAKKMHLWLAVRNGIFRKFVAQIF